MSIVNVNQALQNINYSIALMMNETEINNFKILFLGLMMTEIMVVNIIHKVKI